MCLLFVVFVFFVFFVAPSFKLADNGKSVPRLANNAATSLQAEACRPVAVRETNRRGPQLETALLLEENKNGNESTNSQSKQNPLARPARKGPSEQPTTGQSIRNERQVDQAGFSPKNHNQPQRHTYKRIDRPSCQQDLTRFLLEVSPQCSRVSD